MLYFYSISKHFYLAAVSLLLLVGFFLVLNKLLHHIFPSIDSKWRTSTWARTRQTGLSLDKSCNRWLNQKCTIGIHNSARFYLPVANFCSVFHTLSLKYCKSCKRYLSKQYLLRRNVAPVIKQPSRTRSAQSESTIVLVFICLLQAFAATSNLTRNLLSDIRIHNNARFYLFIANFGSVVQVHRLSLKHLSESCNR